MTLDRTMKNGYIWLAGEEGKTAKRRVKGKRGPG